jgi:hypothetical protein
MYGSLINVRIMAGVTVTDSVSPADSELTMYLEKASSFIENALNGTIEVPFDPVPQIIGTIAEFYASGLFLGRNNLPENQTQHPNVVLAEKKLAEFKVSNRRSYKLVSSQ